jgi:hypothetical protein
MILKTKSLLLAGKVSGSTLTSNGWLREYVRALTNSGSMSKWLKPLVFGIWGLLLIPLIAPPLEKWLAENFFSDPNAAVTTVSNHLVAVGQQRWFKFALAFLTGIVVGVSLEWLARKSDQKKASALRSLGSKFCSLSDSIKTRTASPGWPDNASDLRPAIMSAFISARKLELWVPGERVYELPDASFLCEYFRCVGRLLEDGHFDDANREALSWKPFLDQAKPS